LKVRPKEVTTIRRLQLVNLKIYTYEKKQREYHDGAKEVFTCF